MGFSSNAVLDGDFTFDALNDTPEMHELFFQTMGINPRYSNPFSEDERKNLAAAFKQMSHTLRLEFWKKLAVLRVKNAVAVHEAIKHDLLDTLDATYKTRSTSSDASHGPN